MTEIEQLQTMEREVERQWWWLSGALHAIAQINSGDPTAYMELATQKRAVDHKRVEIASRIAALVGPSQTGQIRWMEYCQKCQRRNVVSFRVEPEAAFRSVVLNRWRVICASCLDAEAEKAKIPYQFVGLVGHSWSERPDPRQTGRRRR